MTLTEAVNRVGCEAWLRMEDLRVRVTIRDVKQAYGSFRYKVVPVSGVGTQWVDQSRLLVNDREEDADAV